MENIFIFWCIAAGGKKCNISLFVQIYKGGYGKYYFKLLNRPVKMKDLEWKLFFFIISLLFIE